MDHPASAPLASARPWRSAAIVAGAIATVELVLLLVAAVAIFAEPFAEEVETAAAKTVAEATAPPAATKAASGKGKKAVAELSRRQTSVMVMNGNGRSGAATEAAAVVRGLHYLVAGAADASRMDVARTLVMYRPGFRGEAERLAQDVRVKRVAPLDGVKPRDLGGAHLVLILGRKN